MAKGKNGSKPAQVGAAWRIVGYSDEPVDSLLANPGNWRIHPKSQQEALAGVIREVGVVQNILVNKTTQHVVDGHLRIALAMRDSQPTVPVTWVELSEAEEALILATLDPLGAMATADASNLDELLRDVQSGERAVQEMPAELARQNGLYQGRAVEDPGAQIDRAGELREKWQTVRGQIWTVGRHRLMCGDSTSAEDVARLMAGQKADGLIVDPPYGMRLDTDFSGMKNSLGMFQAKGLRHGRRYDPVIGDESDYDARLILATLLVWDKRLDESADKMFGSCFELIWSRARHRREMLRYKWAGVFGIEQEPERQRFHPNQKPTPLLADLAVRITGVLVDPYSGVGSTMVAAEQTGRICYGMEIEPKYVAVALERLSGLGLKPVLADA